MSEELRTLKKMVVAAGEQYGLRLGAAADIASLVVEHAKRGGLFENQAGPPQSNTELLQEILTEVRTVREHSVGCSRIDKPKAHCSDCGDEHDQDEMDHGLKDDKDTWHCGCEQLMD